MQLTYGRPADRVTVAYLVVYGVERRDEVQQVVGFLTGAELRDILGFEALLDENSRLFLV